MSCDALLKDQLLGSVPIVRFYFLVTHKFSADFIQTWLSVERLSDDRLGLEVGFGLISRYGTRQFMRGFFIRLQLLFQLVSTFQPELVFGTNGGTILHDLLLRAFYPI